MATLNATCSKSSERSRLNNAIRNLPSEIDKIDFEAEIINRDNRDRFKNPEYEKNWNGIQK